MASLAYSGTCPRVAISGGDTVMTLKSRGKMSIVAIVLVFLAIVVIVWSLRATISNITWSSPGIVATAVPTSWTGTVSVSGCPQPTSTCSASYVLIVTSPRTQTGTYFLNFANGVPKPANGQRITVYGAAFGGSTGTCSGQPQYCLIGTILVVIWQPG